VVPAEAVRSLPGTERTEALVGTITIFARMGVRPENVEKLTALAVEACEVAAEQPGTLAYDWHYSEAHGSLVLLETYADSAAHLSHMRADGHGELMGSLMALIDSLEFFVLGVPTAEHAEALAAVPGAQFYSELARK
jgi:quinol monooxygenase YgiN